MADASNRKARQVVRAAQARFEREQAASQEGRRKAFAQAQKSGLTLREIAKEVGLHHTRVLQIIRGE